MSAGAVVSFPGAKPARQTPERRELCLIIDDLEYLQKARQGVITVMGRITRYLADEERERQQVATLGPWDDDDVHQKILDGVEQRIEVERLYRLYAVLPDSDRRDITDTIESYHAYWLQRRGSGAVR